MIVLCHLLNKFVCTSTNNNAQLKYTKLDDVRSTVLLPTL